MTLIERINQDMIEAMKQKEKDRLTVIRMIKASIKQEIIDHKKEENDDLALDVINKQIKMRNDSIKEFEKAGRSDLVEKTNQELDVLKVYLPEQLKEEELDQIIDTLIKEVNPTSPKDMGKLMGIITPQVKGKADMTIVSSKIKNRLSNL